MEVLIYLNKLAFCKWPLLCYTTFICKTYSPWLIHWLFTLQWVLTYNDVEREKVGAACYLSTAVPYIIGLPGKLLNRHADSRLRERKNWGGGGKETLPEGAAVSCVAQTHVSHTIHWFVNMLRTRRVPPQSCFLGAYSRARKHSSHLEWQCMCSKKRLTEGKLHSCWRGSWEGGSKESC